MHVHYKYKPQCIHTFKPKEVGSAISAGSTTSIALLSSYTTTLQINPMTQQLTVICKLLTTAHTHNVHFAHDVV